MTQRLDEGWLERWHDRHAGATRRGFLALQDEAGRSSYARLADVVGPGQRVLDLACGDGTLLEVVGARAQRLGVDLSRGELALAAQRLGGGAGLVVGRAQALPLAAASVDVVLCHMALMLMNDLPQVLGEVFRVLRRGGALHAVVGARSEPAADDPWALLVARLQRVAFVDSARLVDPTALVPGRFDPLVAELGLTVEREVFAVEQACSADAVWAFFPESYDPGRMHPADLRELEGAWRADLTQLADPARLRHRVQLQTLTVRRA